MSYVPSAAAQAVAVLAGSNMASLASPLTGLQTSVGSGNLAPAAYLDALVSSLGYQAKIIDTAGPGASNTTASTSFVNMPSGCSGTFTAALAKTYLLHVDMAGQFNGTAATVMSFRLVVNGSSVTPTTTMTSLQSVVTTRVPISFRQAVAMSAGANTVQLQWNVSAGIGTFDTSSTVTVHVSG